jgi:hypothetical protein
LVFLTCATSSSTAVGGSLPLFMILVPVLIVDKKDFVKQSEIEKRFSFSLATNYRNELKRKQTNGSSTIFHSLPNSIEELFFDILFLFRQDFKKLFFLIKQKSFHQ